MRGLTDDEAAMVAKSADAFTTMQCLTHDEYATELASDKILARRGLLTIAYDPVDGGHTVNVTPLGLLALQLWKAGIK